MIMYLHEFTVLQKITVFHRDDFKLLIVGLKNDILLIFAISFAFFGMRKDVNEPKTVDSFRFKLWFSLLSDELFLARFAIRFTLPDRGGVSV